MIVDKYHMNAHNSVTNTDVILFFEEERLECTFDDYVVMDTLNPVNSYERRCFITILVRNDIFVQYYINFNEENKTANICIGQINVSKSYRNQGFGTLLMQQIISHFIGRGIADIYKLNMIYGRLSQKDLKLGNWDLSVLFYKKLPQYLPNYNFCCRFYDLETQLELTEKEVFDSKNDCYFELKITK